jgi:NPCBM/NEW2 domain
MQRAVKARSINFSKLSLVVSDDRNRLLRGRTEVFMKNAALLVSALVTASLIACTNPSSSGNALESNPETISAQNPYLDSSGQALDRTWTQESGAASVAAVGNQYALYLSDLPDSTDSTRNGWGPFERDSSNGEDKAGDGKTITLNGISYAKGLGTHANSYIIFDVKPLACSRFQSDIGLDDEIDTQTQYGLAKFNVAFKAQNPVVFTNVFRGNSATDTMNLDISNNDYFLLQTVANPTGPAGNKGFPTYLPQDFYAAHADWANARVICPKFPAANSRPYTTYLSDVQLASASNGWGPFERDRSNGEAKAGDGKIISLNGKRYAKGLGVHADSDLQFDLTGKGCTRFQADVGVDQEVVSSLPKDFIPLTEFAVINKQGNAVLANTGRAPISTSSFVVSLDVNITGVTVLQLVFNSKKSLEDKQRNWFTHGDWANARVTCAQPLPIVQ